MNTMRVGTAGIVTVAALSLLSPSADAAGAAPATREGTLQVCQSVVNDLSTSSAYNFVVKPKGKSKVVASGLIPNGTKNWPGCRAILLPTGSYSVKETPKKGYPVVKISVKKPGGAITTTKAKKGKALTSAAFSLVEYQVTVVTFFNKKG
jgi:hypothetical protein